MPSFTETPSLAPSPKYPNVKLVARPSQERGHADHGWLKTFHTFNFASYASTLYSGFGALRVINEDRVEPSTGFGKHSHREMEIFSYVVSGELEHQDSMGNLETMKRGDVQMTSAGTGISHSEYNRNKTDQAHFLQIWVQPSASRLNPKYYTRSFSDDEKKNKLAQIVGPLSSEVSGLVDEREGTGPVPIHAPLSAYASILSPTVTVEHAFPAPAPGESLRKAYVHVIQTSGYNNRAALSGPEGGARVIINDGLELGEGDGAFAMGSIGDKLEIRNVGEGNVEFLVFDIE